MTSAFRSFGLAGAVIVSSSLLGIPAANAITWDFGALHPGPLGPTQTYTVSGETLTASGFSDGSQITGGGAANVGLFGKTLPGDETGLGLQNDPSGQNEIAAATGSLVRIAMNAGAANGPVDFTMQSVQFPPDAWRVFGSASATSLGSILLAGNDEGVAHMLPFEPFYFFQATGGNVLLGSISAVPGPVVGAGLPGLIAALGGLVAMARRRRQRLA